MKKIIFMLMIVMIASFAFADNEISPVTGEILMDNIDLIAKDIEGQELPSFIQLIAKNQKVNGYITLYNGEIATLNIIIEQGVITKFQKGESEESTLEVRTNEKTITKIISSENPGLELKKAMDDGNINYRAIGITNQIKVGVLNIVYKIFNWFTSEEDQYQETEFSSKYASVEYINQEKEYVNNIQNDQQKEMLLSALDSQKEIALGNIEGERINEKGQILKEVQLKDGSQEFVMLNYDDLKREYEMQERYAGEQWSEITELISDIKSGEITTDSISIQDTSISDQDVIIPNEAISIDTDNEVNTNAFREFEDWNDTIETEVNGNGEDIEIDNQGNAYVIGSIGTQYENYPYYGSRDGILISYNKFGEKNWVQIIGSSGNDELWDIKLDREENIWVLVNLRDSAEFLNNQKGVFLLKYNKIGELLFSKKIISIKKEFYIDPDNNFYFINSRGIDYKKYNITKYNSQFEKQWSTQTVFKETGHFSKMIFDFAGNSYTIGFGKEIDGSENSGYSDGFIIKINSEGEKQWSKVFARDDTYSFKDILIHENSFYVTSSKYRRGIYDQFILRLSLTGDLIWEKEIDSSSYGITHFFKEGNQLYLVHQNYKGYIIKKVLEDGTISRENIKLNLINKFRVKDFKIKDTFIYAVGEDEMVDEDITVSSEKIDLSVFDVSVATQQDILSEEDTNEEATLQAPKFNYNDEFNKEKFNPHGLMYYADELYEQGVLPFWPYLTPARDQGGRGTCARFALVGATEILSMNKPDISEQHFNFHANSIYAWPGYAGFPLALEKDWPYNPGRCEENAPGESGYYVTQNNEIIPCSNTDHQGIPLNNPANVGDFSEYEVWCDEYYINDEMTQCKNYRPYAETTNSEKVDCVLMAPFLPLNELTREEELALIKYTLLELKYPMYFADRVTGPGCGELDENSFEKICNPTGNLGGHAMLMMGYIPKEYIPKIIKNNPLGNFDPNQDYIIIKNSWSENWADEGFFYVKSESVINGKIFGLQPLKYDKYSTIYSGCDLTRSEGVGPINEVTSTIS
jgi:hypothetical protein